MRDLIDRQMAIKDAESWVAVDEYEMHLQKNVVEWLKEFPSAKTDLFGWCTDCKEYDKEAHCCHRFSSVIKGAVDELQLVYCQDCKHYDSHDKRCKVWNHGVEEYEYCYRGREND